LVVAEGWFFVSCVFPLRGEMWAKGTMQEPPLGSESFAQTFLAVIDVK
jgi:hypothetical protein